jgi:2-desacetyl-2-hydroxyethyl bacteriochlorophyllide A dehydrogenase
VTGHRRDHDVRAPATIIRFWEEHMKAWVLHGPRDLRLEERDLDTKHLAPDDIWVETDYSSLSTGTDRGNYEGAERVPGAPDYPRWVGYNNAGTVMGVGSAVEKFKVGDRVFTMKAHQSAYIIKQTENVMHIPDGVSSESASMTYLYHLGFHALRTGGYTPGENVAVVGTGILGLTTISLARAFGARVVALSNSEYRMDFARKVGAHRAWLSDDTDLERKLLDFTDGAGIDLAVLAANPWPAYRAAVESLRKGGRISILSLPGRGEKDLDFNPLALKWTYAKSLTIRIVSGMPPYDYPLPDGAPRFPVVRGCEYLLHLMEDGAIRPADLITHRMSYDQAKEAYEMAFGRDKSMVGVVFKWK